MVHFICHHCQQHLNAPTYKRSRISHCPACGQVVVVPPIPPYPQALEEGNKLAVAGLTFLLLFLSGILLWVICLAIGGELK